MERTRDFDARRFRFVQAGALHVDLSLTPDEIFTAANIGPNGFEVREMTGVNDAYDAEHTDRRRVSDDRHDVRTVASHRRRALRALRPERD